MDEVDNITEAGICAGYQGDISVALKVVGSISLATALLVISLALFFLILLRWWVLFNQRLILYVLLANTIGLITIGLAKLGNYGFCAFGGFINQIGGWMMLNAYISITSTLMIRVFFTTRLEKKWDLPTVIFIFLSPFLFNWIPFINNTYGPSGATCWIQFNEVVNGTCVANVFGEVLLLTLWYVPLYLILTVMIILYIAILVKFCLHRKKWMKYNDNVDQERKQALKYLVFLLVYPLINFTISLFPLVTRAYGLVNLTSPSPVLWLLIVLVYPQQATCVAIVFFVSVRKKITLVNLKAACKEWRNKTNITEYHCINDRELTWSIR